MTSHSRSRRSSQALLQLAAAAVLALGPPGLVMAQGGEAVGHALFESPHFQPVVVTADGSRVYVTNTQADTVDVIDAGAGTLVRRIDVGFDPISLALRPDGRELWVANHVSDSISVIDSDPASPRFEHVIATVQDIDLNTRATQFDEPAGIAFANDSKAYVTLSSTDRVAIIDVAGRQVTGHLSIGAQDPRAIVVRGNRLYVAAFESGNQTELSGCWGPDSLDGDQCTYDLIEHMLPNSTENILTMNYEADIVRDPNVPDRDVHVFDTATDSPVDVVWSVGTLLYGMAVDSSGRVYVAMTEARNDANGRAGTQGHELGDMDNRAFFNQIGVVDCSGPSCGAPSSIELEAMLPAQPGPGQALATPFGIQVSGDDATLVVTAAHSHRLFTVDAASGAILGRTDVGFVPRGIALVSAPDGSPLRAWVYNAIENSVSVVDLTDRANPLVTDTILMDDPTHPEVKEGRRLFNDAAASTHGTYACASCHPDGHTDQLLWVLGGPRCDLPGCDQIPPRSTMPIRGARDTQPYHWDGVQGDPYGGPSGESPQGDVPPNCTDNHSCLVHLIDGGLGSAMCDLANCGTNDEGKAGNFSAAERNSMATYMLAVPHVPARERPFDDDISEQAELGFCRFFDNDDVPSCGRGFCHAMPYWTGTNIPGTAMDAPSFRGLPDRWLITPQGRPNIIDFVTVLDETNNEIAFDYETGFDELFMFTIGFGTDGDPGDNRVNSGSPLDLWQMFLEGSMGTSGGHGRQVTLNTAMATGPGRTLAESILAALEQADSEEILVLQGEGIRTDATGNMPVEIVFDRGTYVDQIGGRTLSRADLIGQAAAGTLTLTLTGRMGPNVTVDTPQPALFSWFEEGLQRSHFPRLPAENPMFLQSVHADPASSVLVDGRRVSGTLGCPLGGSLPYCDSLVMSVQLDEIPSESGMHLLQLQQPGGLLSNEFLFFVEPPTVWESTEPWAVDVPPGVSVGTAEASPFVHGPPAADVLYYLVDDGAGNPPLITLNKGAPGQIEIHF